MNGNRGFESFSENQKNQFGNEFESKMNPYNQFSRNQNNQNQGKIVFQDVRIEFNFRESIRASWVLWKAW